MARRLLAVGVLSLLIGLTLATVEAQTPPRDPRPQPAGRQIPVGTAAISGVVLSAATGLPIRNARVTLNGTAGVVPAARGVPPPGRGTPQPPTLQVSRAMTTDMQGRFTFPKLAQGRYSVSVSRDGYLSASYGQPRPNGGAYAAIELADGENRTISISLSRGGVIAGVVVDEDGEPVRNAQIQLWRIDSTTGVKRLQQQMSVASNDRGAYRFFALAPGNYLVAALPRLNQFMTDVMLANLDATERAIATGQVHTPSAGPAYVIAPQTEEEPPRRITLPSFLPVFFPGAFSPAAAQILTITGNEEREGIDIVLSFARAATVRGTVSPLPADEQPLMVSLVSDEQPGGNTFTTSVNPMDGIFQVENVWPGRYTLLVVTRPGSRTIDGARVMVDGKPLDAGVRVPVPGLSMEKDAEQRLFAQTQIVVSSDTPLDVSLSLRPALSLSGSVQFDMVRPPVLRAGQQYVQLMAAGAPNQFFGSMQAPLGADGSFTVNGVLPGRYFLRVPGTMRSATLGGQDILEIPFEISGDRNVTGVEIIVTDKETELSGTLTDGAGNPLGNRQMLIAPADQQRWIPGSRRILTTTTGPYGRYTFRVPPGDYVVGPVADLESGAQYDPQVLTGLVGTGSHVSVNEGTPSQRDFTVR